MRRTMKSFTAALALLASAALAASSIAQSGTESGGKAPPATGKPDHPATPKGPPSREETARNGILMKAPKANAAGFVGDPYPLDTYPISGEKLGKDAVTVVLKDQKDPLQEGRQIKFCCKDCVAKFEANPAEALAKVDAEIVKKAEASYPLDHCLVMLDEKLGGDAKSVVLGNRLYKFCCKKCINNFQKNSARYVTAYEKAVIGKQRDHYPLETCVVSGEKLGEKHFDFVIGSRLVRTCCEDCAKKVLENPAGYMAKLDAAGKGAK